MAEQQWQSPSIQLTWGPYFRAEPDEQTQILTMVRTALGGGPAGGDPLITRELAVKKIAPIFGIENANALIETLEKERAEAEKKQQAEAQDQHKKSLEKIEAQGKNPQAPAMPFAPKPPAENP